MNRNKLSPGFEQALLDAFSALIGSNRSPSEVAIERRYSDAVSIVLSSMVFNAAKNKRLPMTDPARLLIHCSSTRSGVPPFCSEQLENLARVLTVKDRARITKVFQSIDQLLQEEPVQPETLSAMFEEYFWRTPRWEGGKWTLGTTNQRRDDGAYYTPSDVARFLADRTLTPLLSSTRTAERLASLRIIDPAVGGGIFLLHGFRMLSDRLGALCTTSSRQFRRRLAMGCLFGIDRNPLAAEITRAILWLELNDPASKPNDFGSSVGSGDSLIPSEKCAPSAGVGRFDVVLSNPPWGKIKPLIKEFLSHHKADTGSALSREALLSDRLLSARWNEYAASVRQYGERLRKSSILPGGPTANSGEVDLYLYFMRRVMALLKQAGRAGLVVPASFLNVQSAASVRELYFDNGVIQEMLAFENRRRIFDIHPMFRFLLMVYQRGASAECISSARFALTNLSDATTRGIAFSKRFIKATSPGLRIVPEVRTEPEKKLYEKLSRQFPPLRSDGSGAWGVTFARELDMTNDKGLFIELSAAAIRQVDGTWALNGRRYLPVYEGRMVNQFDAAAKAWKGGSGRSAVWQTLPFNDKQISPHYLIAEDDVRQLRPAISAARAGFCDISGHANERTILSAIIPPDAVCGNKVPTCRFRRGDTRTPYLWVAIANSFIIDWFMRRKVSTTINFFHWDETPFPVLDPSTEMARELLAASTELSRLDHAQCLRQTSRGDAKDLLRQRAKNRAKIDALVAEMFSLTFDEFRLILSGFPLLDRGQPPAKLDEACTITRDTALFEYMKRCSRRVQPFGRNDIDEIRRLELRIGSAMKRGAIPYVSAEQAALLQLSPQDVRAPKSLKTLRAPQNEQTLIRAGRKVHEQIPVAPC